MLYLYILHWNRNRFASLVRAVHGFKALDQMKKSISMKLISIVSCRALTHLIFAMIFSAMVPEKLREQNKLLWVSADTHSCLHLIFSSFSSSGRLDNRRPEIISMTHTALSLWIKNAIILLGFFNYLNLCYLTINYWLIKMDLYA